jgi:2-amino-4-hydroxy-6-hydroxymethyldihydropteridine diphosphokinase
MKPRLKKRRAVGENPKPQPLEMVDCYLGLGSNLRGPKRQLNQAIASLRTLPRSIIKKQSRVYRSLPMGVRAQPNYCNQVIAIQTTLPALALLRHCQSIEKKQQRIRKRHWGARTLDIDILLYGHQQICTRDLTIPHPRMLERDFVLIPLLEILTGQ